MARKASLFFLFATFLLLFVIAPARAFAANLYWVGNDAANTSVASNWKTTDPASCGGGNASAAPSTGDVAIFDADCDNGATIDSTFSVAGMTMSSGYVGTVTQASGVTMTIGSTGWTIAGGTFTGGNSAIAINGAFSQSSGTFTPSSGTMTITSVNFTISGGTYNTGTGTTVFAGTNLTANVVTTQNFNNVTVNMNGGSMLTIASGDTLVVNGTTTLTDGALGTGTLEAKGAISMAATFDGAVASNGGGLLLIDGSSSQSFTIPSGAALPRMTLNQSATTIDFASGANVSMKGNFILTSGTFTAPSGTLTVGNSDAMTVFTIGASGTFNANGGTISFEHSGITLTLDVATTQTLNNVTFNPSSGSTNLAIASGDTVTVNGTLTLTNGQISGTGTLEAKGTVSIASTFDGGPAAASSALLLIDGSSSQSFTIGSGAALPRMTLNQSATTIDFASGANITADSSITVQAGTFTAPSGTLTIGNSDVACNLTVSGGTFNANSGTITFVNNGISCTIDVSTSQTLGSLTVNTGANTSGISIAASDTIIVSGTLTHTNGVINGANSASTLQANGAVTIASTADGGSIALTFGGGSSQTYTDNGGTKTTGTVTVNKTVGSAVTLATAMSYNTAGQDLAITSGTLDLAGFALTVNDQFTVAANGTLQLQGGETITGGPDTLSAGSTVVYNGSSTYSSLPAGNTYSKLTFNGSGTWKPSGTLTASSALTISAGTLDLNGQTLVLTSATFSNDGTLKIKGTETLTAFTQDTDSGTFMYYGDGDSAADTFTLMDFGSTDYYNLAIASTDSADVYQSAAAKVIAGNVTITTGTLDANSQAMTMKGNYTNNATFTAGTGTVTLAGTTKQTLSGTLTGSSAFYDLTITNNSGASASDDERTGFTPSVDFDAAATITHNYTITTANVRVEYNSGSTYTLANINWNGQASGTRIYFRNSAVSGTWTLNVSGTQTAVSYVNVSRSNASGGNAISANDTTNYNGSNNTNWIFYLVPGAPTGLTPTAGHSQVSLTWTAPVSDGGSAITDYVVDYKLTIDSSWTTFSEGVSTLTSATVTGLTNSVSYDFRVSAVNVAGQGDPSSTASATPTPSEPDAPTIGTATGGNAQATVTFSAPGDDGGSTILYYTALSSPGSLTGYNSTSPITVTGLTNGVAYTFTVTATNAVGTSTASSASNSVTASTTPGAPTALTPTAGNTQVALAWSAPSSDGGASITDYVVEYKLSTDISYTTFSDGVSASTGATVTGLTNGLAYNFKVSAVNAVGQGTASDVVSSTPRTVPGAPTGATAVRGNTQATVSFSAPASDGGSAITSYTVTSNPGSITGTGAGSPIVVTGLTNGVAYTFTVTATNAAGTGSASSASNSVTPATVPDAPTSVSATGGNAQATVSFSAPGNDGGSAITLYTVTSSPGGLTGTGASSPIIVTGLTNGVAYTFTVAATNDVGEGSASSASNSVTPLTVPGAPTSASAVRGNAEATVSFSAPASDGGTAITGYTVTSDPGGFIGTGASSPIVVSSLTNGTPYTFTVVATNAEGDGPASDPSNEVTPATVPDAPTGLTPTAGNAEVDLSWTAPVWDGGTDITDYVVEYKLSTDSDWTTFSDSVSTLTSATVTGLDNGSAYDFRVSAVNDVGQGDPSATASATPITVPDAPIVGTATAGNAQATVTFSAPAFNGGTAITSYTVTSSPGNISATDSASPITVTGLTNGVAYTFVVTATNAAGTSASSSPSNSVTPITVPDAPTSVSASPGNAQATVSFDAPTSDGGSAITSYIISASPGGVSTTSASSPAVVTGLTRGETYTFTAKAINAAGMSASSSPSNSIFLSTEPDAPTNLAATVGGSSIDLSWSAPASDGGSTITDYIIEYQLTVGGVWSVFADGTSNSTTGTVTGLSNGTSYDFRVSAVNEIGQGDPSGTVTATPGEPAQVLIQSFPDLTLDTIGTAVRITNEGSIAFEYQYTWCVTDAVDNECGGGDDEFSSSAAKLIQAGENWDTTLSSVLADPGSYYFHISVEYGSETSSAHQSFTAVATYPDAPTIGTATAGNAQATVTFTPPTHDNGSTITSYTVTSNPGGLTGTGASSPIVVSSLSNGTPYTFTVTATNGVGTGSASSASNSVTPITTPGAPVSLSGTSGNGQVELSWSAPLSNGGSAITDYVVEYKLSSDGSYTTFADGVGIITSATVTGLSNGSTYDFRVSAVNAAGQGSPASTSVLVSGSESTPSDSSGGGSSSQSGSGSKSRSLWDTVFNPLPKPEHVNLATHVDSARVISSGTEDLVQGQVSSRSEQTFVVPSIVPQGKDNVATNNPKTTLPHKILVFSIGTLAVLLILFIIRIFIW